MYERAAVATVTYREETRGWRKEQRHKLDDMEMIWSMCCVIRMERVKNEEVKCKLVWRLSGSEGFEEV